MSALEIIPLKYATTYTLNNLFYQGYRCVGFCSAGDDYHLCFEPDSYDPNRKQIAFCKDRTLVDGFLNSGWKSSGVMFPYGRIHIMNLYKEF